MYRYNYNMLPHSFDGLFTEHQSNLGYRMPLNSRGRVVSHPVTGHARPNVVSHPVTARAQLNLVSHPVTAHARLNQ